MIHNTKATGAVEEDADPATRAPDLHGIVVETIGDVLCDIKMPPMQSWAHSSILEPGLRLRALWAMTL